MTGAIPVLTTVVLDCPDPGALAGFYARLLDWPEPETESDGEWATAIGGSGRIDFQRDPGFKAPTWPEGDRAQMVHLDFTVGDLDAAHARALELGAVLLDEENANFRVYADPAGHPFCLCR